MKLKRCRWQHLSGEAMADRGRDPAIGRSERRSARRDCGWRISALRVRTALCRLYARTWGQTVPRN